MPDKVNAPAFKEANEYKADISFQPKFNTDGGIPFAYAYDLAYAPINHLGIITSYHGNYNFKLTHQYEDANNVPSNSAIEKFNLHNSLLDLGIGGFISDGNRGVFECYGGFGAGNIKNVADGYNEPGGYSGDYHRYFIQLSYAEHQDNVVAVIGIKWIYSKFDAFSIDAQADIDSSVVKELKADYNLFVQPYFEVQGGNRFFRFIFQMGCQINLNPYRNVTGAVTTYGNDVGYVFNTSPFYLSLGFSFHHAPRFCKIERKKNDF